MKRVFGKRLEEARGTRKRAELAKQFGVSVTTWGNWERGDKEPDIATICNICQELGVSSDWLLGLTDRKPVITKGFPPDGLKASEHAGRDDSYAAECRLCGQKDATIRALQETVSALKIALRQPDGVGFTDRPSPS